MTIAKRHVRTFRRMAARKRIGPGKAKGRGGKRSCGRNCMWALGRRFRTQQKPGGKHERHGAMRFGTWRAAALGLATGVVRAAQAHWRVFSRAAALAGARFARTRVAHGSGVARADAREARRVRFATRLPRKAEAGGRVFARVLARLAGVLRYVGGDDRYGQR